MKQITICGGGNAAQALAGILSAREDLRVNVYAPFGEEARRWQQALRAQGGLQVVYPEKTLTGRELTISASPEAVVPGSDILLLALPAFAHEHTLRDLAPFLSPDAWVGALPARGGFAWSARDVLGGKSAILLFGLQTLPWACRITDYGREVAILGTKKQVDLAVEPAGQEKQVAATLADLLEVPMQPIPGFLSLDLAGTGQLIHPGIMYGLFHRWDGAPFAAPPLFYQGVTDETADLLESMSAEVQALRARLEGEFPALDLSAVRPLGEWLHRSYTSDIADRSTLRSSFVTNRSYAGLLAPTKPVDGGFVPDFNSRYLSEDIPFSLAVTRGIAELANLDTPVIDRVIEWAQARLNKQYLRHGKLQGRDLAETRAPQRYGIEHLSRLVKLPESKKR